MTHAEMVEEVVKLHEWVKHWSQRAEAAEKALEKMDSAHTKTLLSLYEVKDALAECTCSYQRTDVQPKSLWCPDVKSPR